MADSATTDPSPNSQHIMLDVLHRLRTIEQNIPPRVQTLESAVTEIRQEFREMREENIETASETRSALNAFRHTIEKYDQEQEKRRSEQSKDTASIKDALDRMGRKITFASGAFWALSLFAGLAATALYNWPKIVPILNAIAHGVQAP